MANLIQLRRSITAGRVPASLNSGEIAINEADGLLFFRGSDGSVKSISLLLASVALAGVSTAPTAAPGTNTTQIASTAFVQSAIQALVAAAPGTLDTLKELADAIGDDPNFAVTVTTALGNRVRFDASQALNAAQMRQAQTNMGAQRIHGLGQCYLTLSGANLLLSPQDGNLLMINSALEAIPDAGVPLAPTGVAASTRYFIYTYMVGSVMTLEFSTTAYAVQNGTGLLIKTGDGTHTLVGMWYASAANTWSNVATEGVSYFNPKSKRWGSGGINPATASTTFVEMSAGARVGLLTFPGREVVTDMQGECYTDTNTADVFVNLAIDGIVSTVLLNNFRAMHPATAVGEQRGRFVHSRNIWSDNIRHYLTGVMRVSSGTGNCANTYYEVAVNG